MKHFIRAGLMFAPLAVLADPGHGAPVMHTHWWEIAGWLAVAGAVVYGLYLILSSRA